MTKSISSNINNLTFHSNKSYEIIYQLVADPDDNSLESIQMPWPCYLVGARFLFGSPAPDAVSFPLKHPDGIIQLASQTLSASGPAVLGAAIIPFYKGILIPLTDNTTASAVLTVTLSIITI